MTTRVLVLVGVLGGLAAAAGALAPSMVVEAVGGAVERVDEARVQARTEVRLKEVAAGLLAAEAVRAAGPLAVGMPQRP